MCRTKGRGETVKLGVGKEDERKEAFRTTQSREAGNVIVVTTSLESGDGLVKILPFVWSQVNNKFWGTSICGQLYAPSSWGKLCHLTL